MAMLSFPRGYTRFSALLFFSHRSEFAPRSHGVDMAFHDRSECWGMDGEQAWKTGKSGKWHGGFVD